MLCFQFDELDVNRKNDKNIFVQLVFFRYLSIPQKQAMDGKERDSWIHWMWNHLENIIKSKLFSYCRTRKKKLISAG